MSSTPYEIRYSSYQTAQKRLIEEYHARLEVLNTQDMYPASDKPKFPSHETILKEAQKIYNVTGETLRLWAEEGRIQTIKTEGGHRRYKIIEEEERKKHNRKSYIYARVSSRKQEDDLKRQIKMLQQKYPKHHVLSDIGSGINFKRRRFQNLIIQVMYGNVSEIVVAHKDRLSRFSFELVKLICDQNDTRIKILSDEKYKSPQEELTDDIMSVITVFSSRYYGQRKYNILKKNSNLS